MARRGACSDDASDRGHIEPVRQCAREGIIAVITAPSLPRIYAQRVASGDSEIEDWQRSPTLEPVG